MNQVVPVASICVILASLGFVWLSFQVIRRRRFHKVAFGDAGNHEINCAIRAHGNFAEYTPFFLLLVACAELNKASIYLLIPGVTLFALGRVIHAYGFLKSQTHLKHRVQGMRLTFFPMMFMVVVNLLALFGLANF